MAVEVFSLCANTDPWDALGSDEVLKALELLTEVSGHKGRFNRFSLVEMIGRRAVLAGVTDERLCACPRPGHNR